MNSRVRAIITTLGLIITGVMLTLVLQYFLSRSMVELTSEYQAVVLTNGQTFFGKLERRGWSDPVLTDVHYVHRQVNPETRQIAAVTLRKAGNEWHEPDRMILNGNHIVFIEPVKPGSRVAKLIEELR